MRLCVQRRRVIVAAHPEAQVLLREDVLDLLQGRLTEILVRQELVLRLAHEILERLDVHLREAVARTHRQLELADGCAQDLSAAVLAALVILVVEHVLRGHDVLEAQTGVDVVRVAGENAAVAVLSLAPALGVFVQQREVLQSVDVRRLKLNAAGVHLDGLLVVATRVVVMREAKQRARVLGVLLEALFVLRGRLGVLAVGLERDALGVQRIRTIGETRCGLLSHGAVARERRRGGEVEEERRALHVGADEAHERRGRGGRVAGLQRGETAQQ